MGAGEDLRRKIAHGDEVRARHGLPDDLAQLRDVARPVVGLEDVLGVGGEPDRAPAGLTREPGRQRNDVGGTVPQRRELDHRADRRPQPVWHLRRGPGP